MFIEWLARIWAVNDKLPLDSVDLIVPVSHGATQKRVTHGVVAVTNQTAILLESYGDFPLVAYGVFTDSPNPKIEEEFKRHQFHRGIFVGDVISTIEECWRIQMAFPEKLGLRVIVIVTDEAHSRRCRIVWRKFFPNADIRIVSVPIHDTLDPESPMKAYHKLWKILFFQATPTPLFWLMSRKMMQRLATKLHQPTTKIA